MFKPPIPDSGMCPTDGGVLCPTAGQLGYPDSTIECVWRHYDDDVTVFGGGMEIAVEGDALVTVEEWR